MYDFTVSLILINLCYRINNKLNNTVYLLNNTILNLD